MLVLNDVSKRYVGERDVVAVNKVSFEIEKGRFLAIVGRSGSGKSTLLGMIGGISRPTSGSIIVDDCDQWVLKDDEHSDFRNGKIGFVFQFASLLPTLRAIDNVALPAIAGGILSQQEAYARAHAMLDRVGLSERFDFYPGQLSGGEQRRVAIARALVNSPDLLLADEPTADLDEETEADILNLLIDIQRTFELTLVVVTHNMDIAAHADRVIEMRAGEDNVLEEAPQSMRAPVATVVAVAAKHGLKDGLSSVPLSFAPEERIYATSAVAHGAGYSALSTMDAPSNGGSHVGSGLTTEAATEFSGIGSLHGAAFAAAPDDTVPASLDSTDPDSTTEIRNLYDVPSDAVMAERMRLGEGIERFIGKLVLWAVPLCLLLYGVNVAVATYQDKVIEAQAQEQAALEDLAMGGLRADVKDITLGPGKSYILSLYLRNTTEDNKPIYVMAPAVRAFVQVGLSWQEVSLKPENETMPQVLKITGNDVFNYVFEPDVPDFTQLLPNYMHVRITNDMLVSSSSEPKHELIERNDSYYVYLKPHNVSDETILAKMRFPGKPPTWIPMPPH